MVRLIYRSNKKELSLGRRFNISWKNRIKVYPHDGGGSRCQLNPTSEVECGATSDGSLMTQFLSAPTSTLVTQRSPKADAAKESGRIVSITCTPGKDMTPVGVRLPWKSYGKSFANHIPHWCACRFLQGGSSAWDPPILEDPIKCHVDINCRPGGGSVMPQALIRAWLMKGPIKGPFPAIDLLNFAVEVTQNHHGCTPHSHPHRRKVVDKITA
jgi:hypothetical protein